MRLVELSVTNFRSFSGNVKIPFNSTCTALIGPNNSGKSSILSAIEWVLGSRYPYQLRAESTDYFDTSSPIEITATIGKISANDKTKLMPVCQNNQQRGALSSNTDPNITIKLTIPVNADYVEVDEIDFEDTAQKPELELKLWGFTLHKKQADARSKILSLMLVSPLRRVEDELSASQWTPYGQLMKSVLAQSPQYNQLNNLLGQVNEGIQEAFADQKTELLEDARVVSYVEDINFRLTKDNNPVELLRNLEIFVDENGQSINLQKLGSGTQSAVIIGMMELVLKNKNGNSRLFAIEEPDVFIHPHGIRHLGSLLTKVSSNDATQVIFSTHSPSLVATLEPASIVRVEKNGRESKVFYSDGSLDQRDYKRFVDQDNAEMFFAKKVVLVEGATERFLLPPISSIVESNGKTLDLNKRHISVLNIDGKSSVIKYIKLARDFDIDVVAVLDNDFLGDRTCTQLVEYFRRQQVQIDTTTNATLRTSLLNEGVIVLSRGEIEDYIPANVVAHILNIDEQVVTTAITQTSKTSDAFKGLFKSGKPQYAQLIADYLVTNNVVPQELQRLLKAIVLGSNPAP